MTYLSACVQLPLSRRMPFSFLYNFNWCYQLLHSWPVWPDYSCIIAPVFVYNNRLWDDRVCCITSTQKYLILSCKLVSLSYWILLSWQTTSQQLSTFHTLIFRERYIPVAFLKKYSAGSFQDFPSNAVLTLPYGDLFRSPDESVNMVTSSPLSIAACIEIICAERDSYSTMYSIADWELYLNRINYVCTAAFGKSVVTLYLLWSTLHILCGSSSYCITHANGTLSSPCRIIEHATFLAFSGSTVPTDLSSVFAVFWSAAKELAVSPTCTTYHTRFSFNISFTWAN